MEPVTTIEHANLLIEIHRDDDQAADPQDNDNAGRIYSWARDFTGDESIRHADVPGGRPYAMADMDPFDLSEYMADEYGAVLTIPLRFDDYGSSGSRIYTTDADSANACICFTEKELNTEWSGSADDATKYAEARIGELNAWMEGHVYGYVVKNADGSNIELPTVFDSCWGFIDPDIFDEEKSYTIAAAKAGAEHVRGRLDIEAAERERWACADVVTV